MKNATNFTWIAITNKFNAEINENSITVT